MFTMSCDTPKATTLVAYQMAIILDLNTLCSTTFQSQVQVAHGQLTGAALYK